MRARLEAQGITARIAGRTLFADLDLALHPGECSVVVGPNGAGKSTLVSILAGLIAPATGSIRYDGAALASLAMRERATRRAYLPQRDQDVFPSTVLETVLAGRHPHVPRWQWESTRDVQIARQALAGVGLPELEAREVATLSGGERRRVAIAGVIAQDAAILLLDEPAAHLDLAHQVAVLSHLVRWTRREGKALLMVLHDLHLALRFADHAIALGGGVVRVGPAGTVLDPAVLSPLFGHPLVAVSDGPHRTLLPA